MTKPTMLRAAQHLLLLSALSISATAHAGLPFATDDPEPTEIGHLEIYAPVIELEGQGKDYGGAVSVEVNYGLAPDWQLSIGLPVAFAHDSAGSRHGAGDVELSAKYRFYHNENAGLSIAAFPGLTFPTASNGLGNDKVTALLPVWVQKDSGPWSIFGGGGYAINPGAGNQNYWTGNIAVTRQVSQSLLLGAEVGRHGPDSVGGSASTSLGVAAIYQLKGPLRLLGSAGPTFTDGGSAAGFHALIALGIDL